MRKAFSRALGAAVGVSAILLGATAASATAYTFDFTSFDDFNPTTYTFSPTTGSGPSVKLSSWHAVDTNTAKTTIDTVKQASGQLYPSYGIGVLYGNDSPSSETHQIDNYGTGAYAGTDFLLLQFSQDVSLTSIGEYLFKMDNVACCGGGISYWADTGNLYGAPSTSKSIDLTGTTIDEGDFKTLTGATTKGFHSVGVNDTASASVWMIGAAFNQANDGFKLNNLVVNVTPPSAVPEPASWALMIVGFGAIGGSLRARRRSVAFA